MSLFRWAAPHRGASTHLSRFERKLRMIVFGTLYVIALIPAMLLGVGIALPGPWVLIGILTNPYGFVSSWHEADAEMRTFLTIIVVAFITSLVTSLVLRRRFFN
ncbi:MULTISPECIES: hypothetical protein [unclassified Aurantimonas]|uniref:hypothetical protein n=1 Tax=unclassified Aurantimonas TaxID=2638230 RepID=UPI002E171954|nr:MULTISPECIES: hypothetical protein [unclassified Aurantimonas]MEC5291930.1 hypothetical protein [Aurantimonas sp. C2-3-R2]MEC5413016.1 hypothetical protein [Aurantimonas sp. C2-4-R8]